MNKIVAELAGIHTGDGYIRYLGKRKEWDCSGNISEKEYYDKHVSKLIEKIGFQEIPKYFKHRNTYGIVSRNRKFIEIFIKLGFPSGNKSTTVSFPNLIYSKKSWATSFLKGYFDTDGCFTHLKNGAKKGYPKICFVTVSEKLHRDIKKMLDMFSIKYAFYSLTSRNPKENKKYNIHINGNREIMKWFKHIGSNNPTKKEKYDKWKKQLKRKSF